MCGLVTLMVDTAAPDFVTFLLIPNIFIDNQALARIFR